MDVARAVIGPARRQQQAEVRAPAIEARHPLTALASSLGNAGTQRLLRQVGALATPDAPAHAPGTGDDLASVDESAAATPTGVDGPRSEGEAEAGGTSHAGPGAGPDRTRQLLYAQTTLARVPPMAIYDEVLVRGVLPGTPIMALWQDRAAAKGEVERLEREMQAVDDADLAADASQGTATQGSAALGEELARATERLERIDEQVRDAVAALGYADEQAFASALNAFPNVFLRRAEAIAMTMLDENERMVRDEGRRFGIDLGEWWRPAGPGDPRAERAGMRSAAAEIASFSKQASDAQAEVESLDATLGEANAQHVEDEGYDFAVDEGPTAPPRVHPGYKPAQERASAASWAAVERRDQLGLQYPLLLRTWDHARIAQMSDEELQAFGGGQLTEILDNIATTRENIGDGTLKTWHLRDVFDMTMQDLRVSAESPLYGLVQKEVERETVNAQAWKNARMAIGLTAAVIAALPTAGASLTLAGTAVAVGTGVHSLAESVHTYTAEKAASNVALDPRIADISTGSPEMWPIVLDLMGLGLDVADVLRAVRLLEGPVRAARATGELVAVREAVRQLPALGEQGARRIMATVGRDADVAARVVDVVRATGNRFRKADLALVERELQRLGNEVVQQGFDDLQKAGRIRLLTEESLEEVYKDPDRVEAIITEWRLLRGAGAFYDPSNGFVFLREGPVHKLSADVVHELTHYIQDILRPAQTTWHMEFEAFVVERDYLTRLARDGVPVPPMSIGNQSLLDATDEQIAEAMALHPLYVHLAAPRHADYERLVTDALENLGRTTP